MANCDCDHHTNNKRPCVPWLPKKPAFIVTDNDPTAPRPTARKTNVQKPRPFSTSVAPTSQSSEPSQVKANHKTNKSMPGLLRIKNQSNKQSASQSTTQPTLDSDMMNAQIRINSQIMTEVDTLRAEKLKLQADIDKLAKEKEFFKTKLAHASDQLNYLKKKMDKSGKDSENSGPKLKKLQMVLAGAPLQERNGNSRDLNSNQKAAKSTNDKPLNDETGESIATKKDHPQFAKLRAAFTAKPLQERDVNSCVLVSNEKIAEKTNGKPLNDDIQDSNPNGLNFENGNGNAGGVIQAILQESGMGNVSSRRSSQSDNEANV